MNLHFLERLKGSVTNGDVPAVSTLISGMLMYALDNHMQIIAALSFLLSSGIAIISQYNKQKQSTLDKIHAREMEKLTTMAKIELDKQSKS